MQVNISPNHYEYESTFDKVAEALIGCTVAFREGDDHTDPETLLGWGKVVDAEWDEDGFVFTYEPSAKRDPEYLKRYTDSNGKVRGICPHNEDLTITVII